MKSRSWIFLRGLSRGQGHWGYFPEEFLRRFPEDEIEFLDLPGCGTRNNEMSCLSIEENVEKVRKVSRFITDGKQVHLLAISLGGMVAALWQDLYPQDVHSMTLLNTSFQKMPPWKRFNFLKLPEMLKVLMATDVGKYEEELTSLVCRNEEYRKKNLPLLIEFSKKYPVQKQNFLRQLFAASRVQFPSKLKCSTLLLGSQGDGLVSVECSQRLAEFWNCSLVLHPWAGHDLPIDAPTWILEQLEKTTFS